MDNKTITVSPQDLEFILSDLDFSEIFSKTGGGNEKRKREDSLVDFKIPKKKQEEDSLRDFKIPKKEKTEKYNISTEVVNDEFILKLLYREKKIKIPGSIGSFLNKINSVQSTPNKKNPKLHSNPLFSNLIYTVFIDWSRHLSHSNNHNHEPPLTREYEILQDTILHYFVKNYIDKSNNNSSEIFNLSEIFDLFYELYISNKNNKIFDYNIFHPVTILRSYEVYFRFLNSGIQIYIIPDKISFPKTVIKIFFNITNKKKPDPKNPKQEIEIENEFEYGTQSAFYIFHYLEKKPEENSTGNTRKQNIPRRIIDILRNPYSVHLSIFNNQQGAHFTDPFRQKHRYFTNITDVLYLYIVSKWYNQNLNPNEREIPGEILELLLYLAKIKVKYLLDPQGNISSNYQEKITQYKGGSSEIMLKSLMKILNI